jgi:hypothetical protein
MTGTRTLLDQIELDLKNDATGELLTVYIDTYDSSLSRKWLAALNNLIRQQYHLEKNYCFMGFVESARSAEYIMAQVNMCIDYINKSACGYQIDDYYSVENTIHPDPIGPVSREFQGGGLMHNKLNQLHKYFEELQGVSGHMSEYYSRADGRTRWHIRQLNLLCHEYESLVLSMRKKVQAPEWQRPSQLMCWLNAPRFMLDAEDFELFGIETINRPLGGVFVGVNKAIGKHHFEVFCDEVVGLRHDITELTTISMRGQSEAAGDFDIEWANNPGEFPWQKMQLAEFRNWLIKNGFDPEDKSLTIGFPQCGQVDLQRSFGSTTYQDIWPLLNSHLNVHAVRTSDASATYDYNWSDPDYIDQQVAVIQKGYHHVMA